MISAICSLCSLASYFAVTLFIVVYAGWESFDTVKDGVQLVVASLGGLVGSIIGYYFGESAAERRYSAPAEAIPPAPAPEQQPGQGGGGWGPPGNHPRGQGIPTNQGAIDWTSCSTSRSPTCRTNPGLAKIKRWLRAAGGPMPCSIGCTSS
jgi:hypothetical protein